MSSLAIVFPGIGYSIERPLLYYAKKLAMDAGYKVESVCYKDFPNNVLGSEKKIEECLRLGIKYAEKSLTNCNFNEYDKIIFISKSIGTAVGVAFAQKHNLDVKHVIFTPIKETFKGESLEGIVFHGTNDPWAETAMVKEECSRLKLPLHLFINKNHSLEGKDVLDNIDDVKKIMKLTQRYII